MITTLKVKAKIVIALGNNNKNQTESLALCWQEKRVKKELTAAHNKAYILCQVYTSMHNYDSNWKRECYSLK